jgi:hypothetical protein
VIIPMVSVDNNSTGLSGVWSSRCVSLQDASGFESVQLVYGISKNHKVMKNILRYYRKAGCQGEKTTLTFVKSCSSGGTKVISSGLVAEKLHCTSDKFWRESEKEDLVRLNRNTDFKMVLFQSEVNTLYLNLNVDGSSYPADVDWSLSFSRRLPPLNVGTL